MKLYKNGKVTSILIVVTVIVFSFIGCKKKTVEPSSYNVSFELDGHQQTFTYSVSGKLSGGSSTLQILANRTTDPNQASIEIDVGAPSAIEVNTTYSTSNEIDIIYLTDNANASDYSSQWGGIVGAQPPSNYLDDAKITITVLSNTYIKGTFSGTVYYNDGQDMNDRLSITNGKFYVPRD